MKLNVYIIILCCTSLVAASVMSVGCGAGGEASFSPDPSIGELLGGGDDPADDGSPGGGGGGDFVVNDDGSDDGNEEERDCFLDGFCYRECTSPADCPEGFSCIMTVCTFDCQSDAECGVGGVCNSVGLCETTGSGGMAGCTDDAECGEGRFCNTNAQCEQIPLILGCMSDADCPLGQYCNDEHACELFPGPEVACAVDDDCPGDYYCDVNGLCEQDCRSSVQCAVGEACSTIGTCEAVGLPARLLSFSFGTLGAVTDPAGPVTFESASYRIDKVAITPAGRNQILSSARYRLVGSAGF